MWMVLSNILTFGGFKWIEEISQSNEDLIKHYNEDSDIGYFNETDLQYTEELHEIHNYLPFLPEWMKIEEVEKLVAGLNDKK